MINIASAPAGASGLSAMRRSQVSMRAEAIQADRRAQVLDRVDRLVRGDGLARVGAGKSVGVDSPAAAGQTFRQLRQLRREL